MCDGLSPCTKYNISARACCDITDCGEPEIMTITTTPRRKLYCITNGLVCKAQQ